jgi:hypothetical protein
MAYKMISAEDMFERIDHWANNANNCENRSNKVKSFVCSTPKSAIIMVMSIIKND